MADRYAQLIRKMGQAATDKSVAEDISVMLRDGITAIRAEQARNRAAFEAGWKARMFWGGNDPADVALAFERHLEEL